MSSRAGAPGDHVLDVGAGPGRFTLEPIEVAFEATIGWGLVD